MSAEMQENFDDYEVGTVLTSNDLEFLQLNQFGSADFTATVVLDETTGSKVLMIAARVVCAGVDDKARTVGTVKTVIKGNVFFFCRAASVLESETGVDF